MEKSISTSLRFLWAGSFSLTFFWVLNILKEGFSFIKDFLNFYPPVGPLLGLFIFSILVFILSIFVLRSFKLTNQKKAYFAYVFSAILFFLMVFPPIFKVAG
jgi:hypothetical protein